MNEELGKGSRERRVVKEGEIVIGIQKGKEQTFSILSQLYFDQLQWNGWWCRDLRGFEGSLEFEFNRKDYGELLRGIFLFLYFEGGNSFNNISQNLVIEEYVYKWRLFFKQNLRKSFFDKIWDSRIRKKEMVIMFEKFQLIVNQV